jgi:hypothetical protein
MSIRRAIEANFKWTLDPHFQNGTHQVVESLRTEDRPFPAIVIVAGQATSAIPEQPDNLGNYRIQVSVIVMSSYDETSVNYHTSVVYQITNIFRNISNRRKSRVKGLHIYDINPGPVGEAVEGRKLSSVLNFDATVNYAPVAETPEPI